jgi:hypothetical protein
MFSKLILRKKAGFEVQVTDNPCWQAPILLYPEPNTVETKIKKFKVKLLKNSTVASSPTYESLILGGLNIQ